MMAGSPPSRGTGTGTGQPKRQKQSQAASGGSGSKKTRQHCKPIVLYSVDYKIRINLILVKKMEKQ